MEDKWLAAIGPNPSCQDPKCLDTFKCQLQEARTEWRRRHPK
jgi:hypothetical protein